MREECVVNYEKINKKVSRRVFAEREFQYLQDGNSYGLHLIHLTRLFSWATCSRFHLEEIVMNAKVILAVLLVFAAVPASYAEHFGRGSENSPFASKPVVNAAATVAIYGRASSHVNVAVAEKSEIKVRLAAATDTPGRT